MLYSPVLVFAASISYCCCCCLVAQSCLTLCDTVDCSTPGFPVLHHLPGAMVFVFCMLSFKPAFSLSSFTFVKRFFSSSSLSAIRVVSSAYLRLLIFLPAILVPACVSSSPAVRRMSAMRMHSSPPSRASHPSHPSSPSRLSQSPELSSLCCRPASH